MQETGQNEVEILVFPVLHFFAEFFAGVHEVADVPPDGGILLENLAQFVARIDRRHRGWALEYDWKQAGLVEQIQIVLLVPELDGGLQLVSDSFLRDLRLERCADLLVLHGLGHFWVAVEVEPGREPQGPQHSQRVVLEGLDRVDRRSYQS